MTETIRRVDVVRVDGGPYRGLIKVAVGPSSIAITDDEAVAVLRLMPREVIRMAGLSNKGGRPPKEKDAGCDTPSGQED